MMTTSEIVAELDVDRRRVQYQLMKLRDGKAMCFEKIGPIYLYEDKVAQIVREALEQQDKKRKLRTESR